MTNWGKQETSTLGLHLPACDHSLALWQHIKQNLTVLGDKQKNPFAWWQSLWTSF